MRFKTAHWIWIGGSDRCNPPRSFIEITGLSSLAARCDPLVTTRRANAMSYLRKRRMPALDTNTLNDLLVRSPAEKGHSMKKIYLLAVILPIALLFFLGIGSFLDADAAQIPTDTPTLKPTVKATNTQPPKVTNTPTDTPTTKPSNTPTLKSTSTPTKNPTNTPTTKPTTTPTK